MSKIENEVLDTTAVETEGFEEMDQEVGLTNQAKGLIGVAAAVIGGFTIKKLVDRKKKATETSDKPKAKKGKLAFRAPIYRQDVDATEVTDDVTTDDEKSESQES